MARYTPDERDEIAKQLIGLLAADERIARAELGGSGATGYADRWSDVDVVVIARDGVDHLELADAWADRMYEHFPVVHDFRVSFGVEHVRGFMLENYLELDLGFQPPGGRDDGDEDWWAADPTAEAGFAWHDVLHAVAAVHRGRLWRAHYYIGLLRWRTLTLAGADMSEYKDVDDVRPELLDALAHALPRSLEADELIRATREVTRLFFAELRQYASDEVDSRELADRLETRLLEFIDEAG